MIARGGTEGGEEMPKEKVSLALLFILSAISLLRLLRIASNSASSFPPPKTSLSPSPACSAPDHGLTPKELHLLSSVISQRSPCNLLVFGLTSPKYSSAISMLNSGGTTIFLEGDEENNLGCDNAIASLSCGKIYKIKYPTEAGRAYELLRLARADSRCLPQRGGCPLELGSSLPEVVHSTEWDVVVVDGPSGNGPQAPGRMEVIYTAGAMARRSSGNMTDVVVHDADRMIEKWFSWEFLCHENLVAAKGKLWHFRIKESYSSTRFCSNATNCI